MYPCALLHFSSLKISLFSVAFTNLARKLLFHIAIAGSSSDSKLQVRTLINLLTKLRYSIYIIFYINKQSFFVIVESEALSLLLFKYLSQTGIFFDLIQKSEKNRKKMQNYKYHFRSVFAFKVLFFSCTTHSSMLMTLHF